MNARYNVIYGERSNGETYSVLERALENAIKNKKCFDHLADGRQHTKNSRHF